MYILKVINREQNQVLVIGNSLSLLVSALPGTKLASEMKAPFPGFLLHASITYMYMYIIMTIVYLRNIHVHVCCGRARNVGVGRTRVAMDEPLAATVHGEARKGATKGIYTAILEPSSGLDIVSCAINSHRSKEISISCLESSMLVEI